MLCFFVSCYAQFFFLIISVVREKNRVKLAPAILTGAPTILTKEIIQTPPLVAPKTIKVLSM